MQEDFLWYIWKRQYFQKETLRTEDQTPLLVLKPGYQNHDAGPDFEQAQIKLGDVTWAGQIEMHLKSSDWQKHGHQTDPHYDAVILHVVWEHDEEVTKPTGEIVPVLELKYIVDPALLQKYNSLKGALAQFIPCETSWPEAPEINKTMMLERALTNRLERKSEMLLAWFTANTNDWEETAWQWLAWCFGFKLNQEPMLQLAYRAPLSLLKKVHASGGSLEAVLLALGGLFDHLPQVPQVLEWQKEAEYQLKKHGVKTQHPLAWKRLKTRPTNFPVVRVLQMAAFLKHVNLGFGKFVRFESTDELLDWFDFPVYTSIKWPEQPYLLRLKLGKEAKNTLMINFLSVFMSGYSQYRELPELLENAIDLLTKLKPDDNRIINQWQKLGQHVNTAFDSQALLELQAQYCKPIRCLDCQVGAWLVK